MKLLLILLLSVGQIAFASVVLDPDKPLELSFPNAVYVDAATSRRIDEPALLYSLERATSLTGGWTSVATYSGDGSTFATVDPAYAVSNNLMNGQFEALNFYGSVSAEQGFYRLSCSVVEVPVETYADEFDSSYVRFRSLDGDKVLFHDSGADTVAYAAGLGLADTRAHWSIQYSAQGDRYWITNRETGESINVEQQNSGSSGKKLLVDFGTDGTFRGLSVSRPDLNGNYWNEVGYSPANNMVDVGSNSTPFDIVMTSSFGTDSFNGPAGGGNPPDPANTIIDGVALGDLGITNAAYDYFAGVETFEIRDLDVSKEYNLSFFGSHKYNTDNITVYSVTDSNGAVQASANLTVGVGAGHNSNSVAVIGNVSPEADGTIYVAFVGDSGNSGYLNALRIEELATSGSGAGNLQMGTLNPTFTSYRWKFLSEPGFFRIESGWKSNEFATVGDDVAGTATYASLDTNDDGQKFILEPLPQGALLPWVSYDEDNVEAIGGGATILAPTYDRLLVQAEAQKRSCIELGNIGAYAKWILTDNANAFVLRYAIEDAPGGGGANGTLTLEIRDGGGSLIESSLIPVTSEQAWVYFDTSMVESNLPSHGRPAKRFNEVRVKTTVTLLPDYTLVLRRGSGEPLAWIDVIETELVDGAITVNVPSEYLNVLDYGAVTNDGVDDLAAFNACISAAKSAGKGVYVPDGVFHLSSRLLVSDVAIQGAGMWHTELRFTAYEGDKSNCGFWGNGNNVTVRDLYIWSNSHSRDGSGDAFRQNFGTGSLIENIWAEQVGVGAWIANYTPPYNLTDGLVIRNCRFRNTFADGVNFAHGTKNSVIENCHFRQTGDDSMATWSSGAATVPQCIGNIFRYNTVECNYRASGMGIFGGEGHRVHHNVISDSVSGTALRFNTTFAQTGYGFSTNDTMAVYRNTLYRSGTLGGYGSSPAEYGAINLLTRYGDVENITFSDILIDDVMNSGIYVAHQTDGTGGAFTNIVFDNVRMARVPVGTKVRSSAVGEMEFGDVNIQLDPVRGVGAIQNGSSQFTIIGLAAGRTEFENYINYYDTTPGNTGGVYRVDDVDIEVCAAGGYNVGWIDAGEWLEFNFTNSTAGAYTLSCSTASASGGGIINVLIDGAEAATFSAPATGGWQNWTTVDEAIDLPYGTFTLRFEMETGGYNLDWFSLE
ncbi:carbohydrate-binding protein [Pontiellaceae bacterium B12227]|nr:carbohydrate-binding protein [Pontiellaceae bacterium B12227]